MSSTPNQVITISDLSKLEDVHYMTAYKWVRSGAFGDPDDLPRSSGNFYLIPRSMYEEWVDNGKPKHGKNNNDS